MLKRSRLGAFIHMATVAALAIALPISASAQVRTMRTTPQTFPRGLQWVQMKEVTFNPKRLPAAQQAAPEETKREREALEPYWKDEIAVSTREKLPLSVLYAGITELTLSVGNSAALVDQCDQPGNGRGMQDQYALCTAKLVIHAKSGPLMATFDRFCHLYLDESEKSLADNHTEFAFDRGTATLYSRVIQYGRLVPACNRAVRLG